MKCVIADPDMQNGMELRKILDDYELFEFQGSFTLHEAIEKSIRREPPDIAFIRMGKTELNVFRLVREIRERNRFSKVILMGSHREYAVEAFEYGANGFLLIPFNKKKIGLLLQHNIKKVNSDQNEQADDCRDKNDRRVNL
jgi:two-component SAPR family response regulator